MPANLGNPAMATGLEKVSFLPIPKKGNAEECSNYHTVVVISHASVYLFLQNKCIYERPVEIF